MQLGRIRQFGRNFAVSLRYAQKQGAHMKGGSEGSTRRRATNGRLQGKRTRITNHRPRSTQPNKHLERLDGQVPSRLFPAPSPSHSSLLSKTSFSVLRKWADGATLAAGMTGIDGLSLFGIRTNEYSDDVFLSKLKGLVYVRSTESSEEC